MENLSSISILAISGWSLSLLLAGGIYIQKSRHLEDAARREVEALQRMPIGVGRIELSEKVLWANPELCRIWGRPLAILQEGIAWSEFTHADDLAPDRALVQEIMDGKRDSYLFPKRYIQPDLSIHWAVLTVSAVRNVQGEVEYFLVTVTDAMSVVKAINDRREELPGIDAVGRMANAIERLERCLNDAA